jgi:hypothetical protein
MQLFRGDISDTSLVITFSQIYNGYLGMYQVWIGGVGRCRHSANTDQSPPEDPIFRKLGEYGKYLFVAQELS